MSSVIGSNMEKQAAAKCFIFDGVPYEIPATPVATITMKSITLRTLNNIVKSYVYFNEMPKEVFKLNPTNINTCKRNMLKNFVSFRELDDSVLTELAYYETIVSDLATMHFQMQQLREEFYVTRMYEHRLHKVIRDTSLLRNYPFPGMRIQSDASTIRALLTDANKRKLDCTSTTKPRQLVEPLNLAGEGTNEERSNMFEPEVIIVENNNEQQPTIPSV